MRVSIRTPDSRIPNLVGMKLSAWHKAHGDDVVVNMPLADSGCDLRYVSYVFTTTVHDHHPDAIVGGTGIDLAVRLPDEIEHTMPDYDSWGCDYSLGFTSRGCPNRCPFCFVPEKEGPITAHSDPREFVRPDHDHVVLLDNNILAAPNRDEVLSWLQTRPGTVDFNQGLDARRIDGPLARVLASLKIRPYIRLAVDTNASRQPFERAYHHLKEAGVTLYRGSGCVMVLVGESGDLTEEDYDRVMWVESFGDLDPFAMPFMPPTAGPGWQPSHRLKEFTRWVNRKAVFRATKWDDYVSAHRGQRYIRAQMDPEPDLFPEGS